MIVSMHTVFGLGKDFGAPCPGNPGGKAQFGDEILDVVIPWVKEQIELGTI